MATVYLDGQYLADRDARVSINDRGFLFGDSVYEVIPVYNGRSFRLGAHIARLQHSLASTSIECPLAEADWARIIEPLLREQRAAELSVYIQISRGCGEGRDATQMHGLRPTVLARVSPVTLDRARLARGIGVALLEDIRWQHCDIKANALLGSLLLRQRATQAGAAEAILLRDGELTEGSSSNVFAVLDGVLRTAPPDRRILRGITREVVIELARAEGMALREQALSRAELGRISELFICSSVREIVPVIAIDGRPVGAAVPGPQTLQLMNAFATIKNDFGESP